MLDYIRWIIAIEASLNFFRQNVLSELHAQGSLAFEDETELILLKEALETFGASFLIINLFRPIDSR